MILKYREGGRSRIWTCCYSYRVIHCTLNECVSANLVRKLFCERCEQNYLLITNIVISRLPEKSREAFFDDF